MSAAKESGGAARQVRRGAGLVGAFTMASRILGLVREMLQSRVIGAGVEQSAFVWAFMLPNLSRRIFGEGALTAAFLPVFQAELSAGRREEAEKLARAVATMTTVFLLSVALCGGVAITAWLSCGFAATPREDLMLRLTRLLLPYAVFICGAAFGMAMLNATGRFFASSFVPCLLNFVWIAALAALWWLPSLSQESKIFVVSGAVLFAGALQAAFMWLALRRRGFSLLPAFRMWRSEKVLAVWRATGVAAIGAGAVQISTLIDQTIAQAASPWAAASIAYADRLMELPLAVIGTAFGVVLLPVFSARFSAGDANGARDAFAAATRDMLSLMIPAAMGLAAIAPDAVAALYQGGRFGAQDTIRAARALVCYTPGIVVFGLNKALVPWFQAQGDVKTPMRVSVCMVAANAALNLMSVWLLPVEWRHAGLAASTVVCACFTALALAAAARRRNGGLGWGGIARSLRRVAIASAIMFAALVAARATVFAGPAASGRERFVRLAAEVVLGAAVLAVSGGVPGSVTERLRRRLRPAR